MVISFLHLYLESFMEERGLHVRSMRGSSRNMERLCVWCILSGIGLPRSKLQGGEVHLNAHGLRSGTETAEGPMLVGGEVMQRQGYLMP